VTPRASYRAIGVAMAIAGVVCFSLRPILIKLAYGYVVDPITLLALLQLAGAALVLAGVVLVTLKAAR
jgi:drug/metabolite transporter (DMT)-like permease